MRRTPPPTPDEVRSAHPSDGRGATAPDPLDEWERLAAAYQALAFEATGGDTASEKAPTPAEATALRELSRALHTARQALGPGDAQPPDPQQDGGTEPPPTVSELQARSTLDGILRGTVGEAVEGDPTRGFLFAYTPAAPRDRDPTAPRHVRVEPGEPGRARVALVVPDGTHHWIGTLKVRG